MISVQTLWLTLRDLSRKENIGGYLQNAEFNRQVALCQHILFDYYYSKREEAAARGALVNFEASALITKSAGVYPLPGSYKEKMEAALVVGTEYYPVHFPARDELLLSLSSAIRGPSLDRKVVLGKIRETDIQVWPDTAYKLFLHYYIYPPAAARIVVLDTNSVEEIYYPLDTVDLDWPAEMLPDFVDLMLLFKGLAIRDSSLIQWVQARKALEAQITND